MAQHFNISVEDMQRMCTSDGQSVQFVLQELNTVRNGTSQIIYTVPQNNQPIFSHQTFNLAGQISTTPLDQRQNVYIIKTSEGTAAQTILKTNPVETHLVAENVLNIIETKDTKGANNAEEAQQSQWVNVQENKAVGTESVLKQSALVKTPAKAQHNTLSTILVQTQGHCSQPNLEVYGSMEKKPVHHYIAKTKNVMGQVISPQAGSPRLSGNQDQVVNPATRVGQSLNRPRLSLTNEQMNAASRGMRAVQACNVSPRSSAPILQRPSSLGQNQNSLNSTDMEHLSERIRREKLKQVQAKLELSDKPQIVYRTPSKTPIITQRPIPVQKPISAQRAQFQQRQSTPRPQNPGQLTPQRQGMTRMVTPKQQGLVNSGRVDQRRIVNTPQRQKTPVTPQRQATPMQNLQSEQNVQVVHAESPEVQEKGKMTQQSCTPKPDPDGNSSESYAYLQRVIGDPATAIVQQQIKGNVAKMLVVLLDGEQRLITFDIPVEDCTVQDLLEQVNVPFGSENIVSLVNDPTLGINYIVEVQSGDSNEQSDSKSASEESARNSVHSSPSRFACDENSNSSSSQTDELKYVEGRLAVCIYCGFLSSTFNQCQRCRRKLPKEIKSVSDTIAIKGTKENANSGENTWKKADNPFSKVEKGEKETPPKPRGRPRSRPAIKKPVKEPECLIISSDEEHENEKSAKQEESAHQTCMETQEGMNPEDLGIILKKEPIITNQSATASEGIEGGDKDSDDEMLGCLTDSIHTTLLCRTVRIGSYKYVPIENVIVSEHGLRLNVPFLEDNKKLVTVDVKFREIVRVLIHFGKGMPVLFFYTSTNMAATIREVLGMQDPKGPYYDPASLDHTQKRITLLPEVISPESSQKLKELYASKLEELNAKEANDILVRASPIDCLQQVLSRRHTTQPATTSNTNGVIQTITVYPPPPAKGGIAINTEDYLCLGEDQFLNDVIIDFYLKYLTSEVFSEADRNRTHVFSSYFYKRLTSPHASAATDSNMPQTAAAKRHARVQKWTKNVNIFEKDFIVIPINEHAHWFLAIICFPGLVGKVLSKSTKTKESEVPKTVNKSKKAKEMKLQAVTIGSTTITPVTTTITIDQGDDGSERDEAEGDDEEMEMDTEDDEDYEEEGSPTKTPKAAPPPRPTQEKEERLPCILIFDSLAGASRCRVVATLRDYLFCEHIAKQGSEKVFSKDTIKGASPKVPQQSNFTDCGVYVLQYVESFFKDPIKNYTLPIKTLKTWFEEIVVTRKREEISKLLIQLMKKTKSDKNISLPSVSFPTQDGKLKAKPEPEKASKSEEGKKIKTEVDSQTSTVTLTSADNSESGEQKVLTEVKRAIPIIPYSSTSSSSCSSTEGNAMEVSAEAIPPVRSSTETMMYLKSKRIERLLTKSDSSDDKPAAKKLKSDNADSCK